MSRSTPFFNPTAPKRYAKVEIVDDKAYAQLHWTDQLQLRPLRDRKRYEWPEGDRNTRLDHWEAPEDYDNNDKEIK